MVSIEAPAVNGGSAFRARPAPLGGRLPSLRLGSKTTSCGAPAAELHVYPTRDSGGRQRKELDLDESPADAAILEWRVRATEAEMETLVADLVARRRGRPSSHAPGLTVLELACALGKSPDATYRLLWQGRIPGAFNDGPRTRWHIPPDAAERYFERGERHV